MARTTTIMATADTGGLQLISATNGTPTASTAQKRTGEYSYLLAAADWIEVDFTISGQRGVFGAIYVSALPGSTITIVEVYDFAATPTVIAHIDLNSSGDLIFIDQGGTTLGTASAAVSAATWLTIEWLIQNFTSADSRALVDGTQVFSTSTADHRNSDGNLSIVRFNNPSESGITIHVDDIVVSSWTVLADDDLGPGAAILGFQPGKNDVTPDFDDAGVVEVSGNDLDIGTWLLPSDVPWNDTTVAAEYTGATAVGGCVACDVDAGDAGLGPAGGNKIVTGVIKAAMWGFRGDRSGGGATTQEIVFGSFDGGTNADMGTGSPKTVTLESGAATTHVVLLEASDAGVPSATDTFVIGIANDGGRDWELIAYQCFLLIVYSTTVTDLSDLKMPKYSSPGLTVEV